MRAAISWVRGIWTCRTLQPSKTQVSWSTQGTTEVNPDPHRSWDIHINIYIYIYVYILWYLAGCNIELLSKDFKVLRLLISQNTQCVRGCVSVFRLYRVIDS